MNLKRGPAVNYETFDIQLIDREIQILVIGKTKSGKSTVCNSLLGEVRFPVGDGPGPTTVQAQLQETVRGRERIKVVDTPDFTNHGSESEKKDEVSRWKSLCSSSPSIILLAIRSDRRYTQEEHNFYRAVKSLWGDRSLGKRLVLVFTFADRLERNIGDELANARQMLTDVRRDAHGRYLVFNARGDKATAVNQVLALARTMQEEKPRVKCILLVFTVVSLLICLISIVLLLLDKYALFQNDLPAVETACGAGGLGLISLLAYVICKKKYG